MELLPDYQRQHPSVPFASRLQEYGAAGAITHFRERFAADQRSLATIVNGIRSVQTRVEAFTKEELSALHAVVGTVRRRVQEQVTGKRQPTLEELFDIQHGNIITLVNYGRECLCELLKDRDDLDTYADALIDRSEQEYHAIRKTREEEPARDSRYESILQEMARMTPDHPRYFALKRAFHKHKKGQRRGKQVTRRLQGSSEYTLSEEAYIDRLLDMLESSIEMNELVIDRSQRVCQTVSVAKGAYFAIARGQRLNEALQCNVVTMGDYITDIHRHLREGLERMNTVTALPM